MAGNNYHKKNGHKRYQYSSQNRNTHTNADMSSSSDGASRYARDLLRQDIINANVRTVNKSVTYSLYTRDDIIGYLQNPTTISNQKYLRQASQYMYVASMQYHRLIDYYAGLYKGYYLLTPSAFQKDDVKDAQFAKQYRRVSKIIENMDIPAMLRNVITVALRDGAYYGILLADNNSAFIYPVDPDYCIIDAIVDGSFVYSVDVTQISRYLEFYPDEFTKMYNEYLKTGQKYQPVPPEICVCIKADSSILNYTLPRFAAVMPSIYTIANMEALEETATEIQNYKMLMGKIPTDDKGAPLMDDATVSKFYKHIANGLGDKVGLALTPFDVDVINFERKDSEDVDAVTEAVTNFWSTAGTSGLLHGKDNNTAGVIKLAVKNDETFVQDIIHQFERMMNRYLKSSFAGTQKFKLEVLPVTIFNYEDMLDQYRNSASMGIGKSAYAAMLNVPQHDVAGLDYMEKTVLGFEDLTPLQSSYTSGASGAGDGEAGRPASDDTNLQESGVETRENDTNANR